MIAFAQSLLATYPLAAAPDAQAGGAAIQSVWDFIVKGGPVMIPIGLCSLVALAVIVERLMNLRRHKVAPADFLPGLANVLSQSPHDRDQALEYCKTNGTPIANIVAAGIRHTGESVERIEKHIEDAGQREIVKLRKYLRLLSLIASIAPLLGLLGTIFGMITAFQTVAASGEALGKTELLAKGIYEAMITTAAGLSVAIPVLIGYHWISARIDQLVAEMDRMTVGFVEENMDLSAAENRGGTASRRTGVEKGEVSTARGAAIPQTDESSVALAAGS